MKAVRVAAFGAMLLLIACGTATEDEPSAATPTPDGDATHGELRDPSTPGGRLVADQIDALAHGRGSIFDEAGSAATLSFDGDRCSFDEPATTTLGRPLLIRLVDDSDVPVWFSMVAFGPDLTDAKMTAIVTAEPRSIDDPPHDVSATSFALVEPCSEGEMTWVFLSDSLR